jgi:hypothetical protein
MPVAAISAQAAMRSVRGESRQPIMPMPSVVYADPSSARVATSPISNAPKPRAAR